MRALDRSCATDTAWWREHMCSRSLPPVYRFPGLAELRARQREERAADEARREAAGGTARLQPGTYDLAYCVVLALRQGTVLHCGGLSVGQGRIVDWWKVKSGEVVAEGPDCLLAVEAIRRVGLEALAAALVGQL